MAWEVRANIGGMCKTCSCRRVVLLEDREAYLRAQDQPPDLAARGRERLCGVSRQITELTSIRYGSYRTDYCRARVYR